MSSPISIYSQLSKNGQPRRQLYLAPKKFGESQSAVSTDLSQRAPLPNDGQQSSYDIIHIRFYENDVNAISIFGIHFEDVGTEDRGLLKPNLNATPGRKAIKRAVGQYAGSNG